jgi:hypothetical protein
MSIFKSKFIKIYELSPKEYNGDMNATQNSVFVRRAVMDDLADISRLAEQLGYPNSLEDMQKRLQVILNNPEQAVFVVDTASKKVAGYIHAVKHVFIEVDPVVDVGGWSLTNYTVDRDWGKPCWQP